MTPFNNGKAKWEMTQLQCLRRPPGQLKTYSKAYKHNIAIQRCFSEVTCTFIDIGSIIPMTEDSLSFWNINSLCRYHMSIQYVMFMNKKVKRIFFKLEDRITWNFLKSAILLKNHWFHNVLCSFWTICVCVYVCTCVHIQVHALCPSPPRFCPNLASL